MAEVHHFSYGWINPVFAYALSFLGSLLGLVLATRSRESRGAGRARWLTLSALAIGGTGVWLAHFMALLGFDVPSMTMRYDLSTTVLGFGIAFVALCFGLYLVGFGTPKAWKIIVAGVPTGVGVAAAHYTGTLALRLQGVVQFDAVRVGLTVVVAIVASTVTLWFVAVIRGASGTVIAAATMALASVSTHYTSMSAVRVLQVPAVVGTAGVPPFVLLIPVCVLACLMISGLAYSTVGFSLRDNTPHEEALLATARSMHVTHAGPPSQPADRIPIGPGQR